MYIPFQAVQKCNGLFYLNPDYFTYLQSFRFGNDWHVLKNTHGTVTQVVFEISTEWRDKLIRDDVKRLFAYNDFKSYVLDKVHETEAYWVRGHIPVEVVIQINSDIKPKQIRVIFKEKWKS